VQADMHYQHTLLGKILAAWKVGGKVLFFVGLGCVCLNASGWTEELPHWLQRLHAERGRQNGGC